MKMKGTLKYVDLGPGQWVLETQNGQVALFGDIDQELTGKKVVVTGSSVEGQSASMTGDEALMVQSIEAS